MMATLTHRPANQRPQSSPPPTFSPPCAPALNPLHFLQRFIDHIFPATHSHRIITPFDYPKNARLDV